MTGQVKEDIIARWGELGLLVRDGCISFNPILLRKEEFLTGPQEFVYLDVSGVRKSMLLEKHTLAYTYCQVPVTYQLAIEKKIKLYFKDGSEQILKGDTIHEEHSASIFRREGRIIMIEVWLEPEL
ncbi:MAG: hypothetical protein KAS29_05270 [Bacteroidales bacterium]|nr:hypothetical protein [Bacteroidales bacterium]